MYLLQSYLQILFLLFARQEGPPHQRENAFNSFDIKLRDNKSTEFSLVGTCLHSDELDKD